MLKDDELASAPEQQPGNQREEEKSHPVCLLKPKSRPAAYSNARLANRADRSMTVHMSNVAVMLLTERPSSSRLTCLLTPQ